MSALSFALTALGLAAIAAAVVLVHGADREAEAGDVHTVQVRNFEFCTPGQTPCPANNPYDTTLSADVGATIGFQHVSGLHTASHCTDGTFSDCTGNLFHFSVSGGTQNWDVPESVDNSNVYFRCNIHNEMQGRIIVGDPGATTPTVSPSPSPTPSPTASPTPTETAAPTPSTTATPAPTESAGPTASAEPSGRSDVNCDGETDGEDVLALLLYTGDTAAPAGNGCPPLGSAEGDEQKGDLNCDGAINGGDALLALYVWAGLRVSGLPAGCPGP